MVLVSLQLLPGFVSSVGNVNTKLISPCLVILLILETQVNVQIPRGEEVSRLSVGGINREGMTAGRPPSCAQAFH